MIRGMHALYYSTEPQALRAFLGDKLGLAGTDVGEGWLIFDAPEADLGVHPTDGTNPPSGTGDISFYCDDIAQTVAELKARGVEFTQEVEDHGYGLVTFFKVPGNFKIQLYQPKYQVDRGLQVNRSTPGFMPTPAARVHNQDSVKLTVLTMKSR